MRWPRCPMFGSWQRPATQARPSNRCACILPMSWYSTSDCPTLNGMEVAAQLYGTGSHVKIVVLSAYSDKRFVTEMLRLGASGYVTKSAAGTELVRAIRAVMAGQGYFSPDIAGTLASAARDGAQPPDSPRLARRDARCCA